MAHVLAVNPRRRRRRRRRNSPVENVSRRRRRRRRRRNNPILRITNPRAGMAGKIQEMLMPAALVSVGAVLASVIPRKLLKVDQTATKHKKALAAIGTGLALSLMGARFLGPRMAQNLALGATAAGVGLYVNDMLPAEWRLAGIGGPLVNESAINEEIQAMTAAGIIGNAEDLTTVEGIDELSEADYEVYE